MRILGNEFHLRPNKALLIIVFQVSSIWKWMLLTFIVHLLLSKCIFLFYHRGKSSKFFKRTNWKYDVIADPRILNIKYVQYQKSCCVFTNDFIFWYIKRQLAQYCTEMLFRTHVFWEVSSYSYTSPSDFLFPQRLF